MLAQTKNKKQNKKQQLLKSAVQVSNAVFHPQVLCPLTLHHKSQ